MTTPAIDIGRAAFPAFGGTGVVLSAVSDRLDSACAAVRAEIEAMEMACSRLRADSELSRLNSNAGHSVPVSGLFAEALEVALRAARLTDGALDPTYAAAAPAPGWRSIEWDSREQRIRIRPDSLLDFHATAKVLAADRAAYAAHRAADCGVLLSLDGDIAVHGQGPDGGWPVRSVILTEGGLATSSTAQHRRWWRTVSVTAITCVDAKIAATAAIIRGESAVRWLTDLGLPARLVHNDGSVLILDGWPTAANQQSGLEPV